MISAILTDIEGTTSSIDFVHNVLFPYSAKALPEFVVTAMAAGDSDVMPWLEMVASEAGLAQDDTVGITETLLEWLRADRKHTALKALQGMIWRRGYEQGEFKAHVYPDVAPVLRAWSQQGLRMYVYSSGSIAAQQMFFRYSEAGDLGAVFSGYFDTTSGPKRESTSYRNILACLGLQAEQVLFLSDITEELDAARAAGLSVCWLVRKPETTPLHPTYPPYFDFTQIQPRALAAH